MRTFIGTLSLFLSVALAQAAQVFPASTNGNNVFTGHNTFTQPINGSGSALSNVNTSAHAIVPAGSWVWMGAPVLSSGVASAANLLTSSDGITWNNAGTIRVFDPAQASDLTTLPSPAAYRWVLLQTNGTWWAAVPSSTTLDGHTYGPDKAVISLWQSSDTTNWSKEFSFYPLGRTNSQASIWDCSWFQDSDSAAYLIYSYRTNVSVNSMSCFAVKALDITFTNWGTSFAIDTENYTQNGQVVKTAGGVYRLYFRHRWPGSEWMYDTNSSMAGPFYASKTNVIGAQFDTDAQALDLRLLHEGGNNWTAYVVERLTNTVWRTTSSDDLETFATWDVMTTNTVGPQGIVHAVAGTTNTTVWLGATNNGQVRVAAPLFLANTVQAASGRFVGLVGDTIYSPNSLITPGVVSAGTVIPNSIIATNSDGSLQLNLNNILLDASGNMTALSFAGDGSQLTGLDWNNITGSVPSSKVPGATKTIAVAGPASDTIWLHYTNGVFYGATTNSP